MLLLKPKLVTKSKLLVNLLAFLLSLPVVGIACGQFPNAIGNSAFPNSTGAIPPTAQLYPNSAGILGPAAQYRKYVYMLRRIYRQRRYFDVSAAPSWNYIESQIMSGNYPPIRASNGDWFGRDNDYDGVVEPVYVQGHFRDGKWINSHYRALPGYGVSNSTPSMYRSGF